MIPQIIDNKIKLQEITCKQFLPKGTVIVFPSFVWHKINPIKKGVRYSLVSWIIGYPFT